jgi:hypothetical protein
MGQPTFSFMMRRHTRLKEPIGRLYADLIAGLARASTDVWKFDKSKAPKMGRLGAEDLVAFKGLSRCYSRRLRCQVHFPVREEYMPDCQSSDDGFVLDWQPKTDDYTAFVSEIFGAYVSVFQPYRATLGSAELSVADFEKVRVLNWRYEVGRIYPVDFLSAGLCKSSFGKTPKQCARLIRQSRLLADEYEGGLMVRSSEMLGLSQCDSHNNAVRLALLR